MSVQQMMEQIELYDMTDEDNRDLIAADFFRETGIDLATSRAPHLAEETI